jgi:hypothetical protein
MVSGIADTQARTLAGINTQFLSSMSTLGLVGLGVAAVLVILLLVLTLRVVRGAFRIHEAAAEGRRVSAEQSGTHPLTNFTRNGVASDPLNVKVIGTDVQMATAFAAAGWYRADEIYFVTSLRITVDAILGRKYATAPMSYLYLFGRKQDYAFERPGRSVRERDHVRFWDTGQRTQDGRPMWIGGATRDVSLEIPKGSFLPTHKIGSDVDTERAIVMRDLILTGWVVDEGWEPGFGQPTHTHNATGDPYYTDGQVMVLTLASVPSLLPLATQVRSPLAGRLVQTVAHGFRWRLPKTGRTRANVQRHRERQGEREKAGVTTDSRGG